MPNDILIDLTGYKDKVGARVTEGRYRVVVEDCEQDKSAAGNDMINLWLRIVGGEFDGQTIVDRLVLTGKSLFRVVGFMQAIGLPTPKKRLKVSLDQFKGKTLEVDVADGDPYNGRVKSEVRGYLQLPRTARANGAAAPDALAALDGNDDVDEAFLTPATDTPATVTPPPASTSLPDDDDGDVDLSTLTV
jgi:hypothetical protein